MKNERAAETTLIKIIVDLSEEWLLIFEKDQTLIKAYCKNESIEKALESDVLTCITEKDRIRFQAFKTNVIKTKTPQKSTFTFFIDNQYIQVELKATYKKGITVMRGTVYLQEAQQRITRLIQNLPIAAISLHVSGHVINYNEWMEKLIHQLELPLLTEGKTIFNKVEHGFLGKLQSIFFFMKNAGEMKGETYRAENLRLELQGVIIDDNTFLILIKDESSQEKYEQLLTYQQQMEAVSQIAAGVAHELRNPLSVIRGFLQLSRLSDDLGKYYETIISEIDRMNKIIEDFLSVSRKKVEKKYVQPEELLDSIIMIFHSECLLRDVELSYNITKTPHSLFVNEQMIKQVLLNILRNSIEAYDGQKKNRNFIMNTEVKEGQYCIELVDKGPGIPQSIMTKIDEPFYTTKEKGTGIGIPLCKQIIEEHQGEFFIFSEEGQGTSVELQLPLFNIGVED